MNSTFGRLGNLTGFVTRYVKAHHIRRGAFVAVAVTFAVVFFCVGAFVRLLSGPVSLGPFSDRLSQALATALPGLTVRYDQAALEWSREEDRINLVILGARVFDAEGRIIAQAPKAELALAAAALIHGDVELRRIALVGVQLTLVRTRNGEIRLGIENGHGDEDILKRITDAINKNSGKKSSLQTFAVHDARIAFLDEGTGMFLVAPRADVQVQTAAQSLEAMLNADIEVSGHPTRVALDVKLPQGTKPVSGTIEVSGLDLDALGRNAKALEALKGLKLVTDVSASFTLAANNHLGFADFGIGATGTVTIPGFIEKPMRVQTLRAVARYDGIANRILIDDLQLNSDGADAHTSGRIDIERVAGDPIRKLAFDLSADKIAVNVPSVFPQSLHLTSAALRGAYQPSNGEIDVERLVLSGGPFTLTTSGKVTRAANASPAIQAQATIAPLAMRDLLRYWPHTLATGAWEWANRNVKAGRIGPVIATANIPAGAIDAPGLPDNALTVTAPVTNATMAYFHSFTPLTGINGTIKLTGDNFGADITSAKIGPLVLSQGKFAIPDLHLPTNVSNINAHVDGRLPDILTLIDMEPLHYATRFHIDPKTTLGAASMDIAFKIPTRHDVSDKDISISVKSALKGLAISLGAHTRLTDGVVNLTVDNDHLYAQGDVTLYGSRLTASWNELFETPRDGLSSHIEVKGNLDDTARDDLNFHSADFVKGITPMTGVITGQQGQLRHADMTLDVTGATIGVQSLGIGKPAGTAGTAVVSAIFAPGGIIQSATMKIAGPGLAANGVVSFDKQGTFTQVAFPSVHEGPANDFGFTMVRMANGGRDITIRGASLDGTKIGRHAGDSGASAQGAPVIDEESNEPFHINAHLDHLVLRNNVTISPFALDTTGYGEDRPQTLTFSGMLGKAPISGSVTPGDNGRKVAIQTDDTGMLLNGLFGFTSMKGGTLAVAATLPGKADAPHPATTASPDYLGTATISDFRIVNQPFLTRLFSAGSLTGIVNLMGGQGIDFEKATIPFASRNGVVNIRDARASSGAIGMTADGYLDRPKTQLALTGSLVPIFGVNSILGAIPLLGDLLVSKKGEGIFGMTYTAEGAADEPKVSVNPLSMLTPGIFRRIFEGRVPEDAQISQLPQPTDPVPQPKPKT